MTLGRNRRSGVGHRAKVEAVKHEEEAGEEPTPKIFKFYIFPSMHFGQENKMFLSPPVENVVKHVLKEMLKNQKFALSRKHNKQFYGGYPNI